MKPADYETSGATRFYKVLRSFAQLQTGAAAILTAVP